MIFRFSLAHLTVASVGLILAGCVHTPPGTSVKVALARKAEMVRPAAAPNAPLAATGHVLVPPVEPDLPVNDQLERTAEAFSRATFCLEAGKDAEAIAAFEETVTIDPTFTEAWENLAVLYEKSGDTAKALEAFRKVKNLAKH